MRSVIIAGSVGRLLVAVGFMAGVGLGGAAHASGTDFQTDLVAATQQLQNDPGAAALRQAVIEGEEQEVRVGNGEEELQRAPEAVDDLDSEEDLVPENDERGQAEDLDDEGDLVDQGGQAAETSDQDDDEDEAEVEAETEAEDESEVEVEEDEDLADDEDEDQDEDQDEADDTEDREARHEERD